MKAQPPQSDFQHLARRCSLIFPEWSVWGSHASQNRENLLLHMEMKSYRKDGNCSHMVAHRSLGERKLCETSEFTCLCTDATTGSLTEDIWSLPTHTRLWMHTNICMNAHTSWWCDSGWMLRLLCEWWGSSSITQWVSLSVSESIDQSHKYNQMEGWALQASPCAWMHLFACVCTCFYVCSHLCSIIIKASK